MSLSKRKWRRVQRAWLREILAVARSTDPELAAGDLAARITRIERELAGHDGRVARMRDENLRLYDRLRLEPRHRGDFAPADDDPLG